MSSEEEQKGAPAPGEGGAPPERSESDETAAAPGIGEPEESAQPSAPAEGASAEPPDDSYGQYDDGYGYESKDAAAETAVEAATPAPPPPAPPAPPGKGGDEQDDEEEGMLRMSFLEHLEELRTRILLALAGVGVAFVLSLVFANELWVIVSAPAIDALKRIGADPTLAQITPMDAFTTIWVKVPMLAATFLASPWILYQVWAFIAPGLYRRERRWAGPFVISTAGLFILGGLFAYFVAFRFGLEFLLSIGRNINVKPVVSLTEYFDLFVNVMLGIGLVFEMPILIFFLALLRIASPGFLIRNSRYAILIIVIIAAIVTPTPDVFNLMLFSVPMCLLYFVGVFAAFLLYRRREGKSVWLPILMVLGAVALLIAGSMWLAIANYGYRLVTHPPFLVK